MSIDKPRRPTGLMSCHMWRKCFRTSSSPLFCALFIFTKYKICDTSKKNIAVVLTILGRKTTFKEKSNTYIDITDEKIKCFLLKKLLC